MKTLLRFAIPLLLLATLASAALIYDRPYDVNNAVSWTPTGKYIIGDDMGFAGFSVPGTINQLSVWMVGHAGSVSPLDEISGINLYLGLEPGPLNKQNATPTSFSWLVAGTYNNPLLGTQPVFKITWTGLNYAFPANVPVDFAVEGLATGQPFNLASAFPATVANCPGGPHNIDAPAPASCDAIFTIDTGTFNAGPYSVVGTTADRSGDINVNVQGSFVPDGSVVPEPSTFALLGLGTAALVYFRRRRA